MPFRAGTEGRELLLFSVFSRSGDKDLPKWVPGWVFMGPLPGQPRWILNLDVIFWSNVSYIIGSIVYVAQAVYFVHRWHQSSFDDDSNPAAPSNYLNCAGAALFIFNALACFVDWWLCKTSSSIMNVILQEDMAQQPGPGRSCSDFDEGSKVASEALLLDNPVLFIQGMNDKILNYYWWNNLFFLVAAIIFLIDGVWSLNASLDATGCETSTCGDFTLPFVANMFYLLSSLFSILEYYENNSMRIAAGLPIARMFTLDFWELDWFGWGDWLYLLCSLMPCVQSFVEFYNPWSSDSNENNIISLYYFVNQVIWLFDSLAYMIGYLFFMSKIIQSMKTRQDYERSLRLSPSSDGDADTLSVLSKLLSLSHNNGTGGAALILSLNNGSVRLSGSSSVDT